mmetsp:Transcript_11238/g.12350  ORF Transcript_11238/g.12350 Transcript_11238/m.12350 type:complete len:96 (-) Transcript_11238:42-329(-)
MSSTTMMMIAVLIMCLPTLFVLPHFELVEHIEFRSFYSWVGTIHLHYYKATKIGSLPLQDGTVPFVYLLCMKGSVRLYCECGIRSLIPKEVGVGY